MVDFFRDFPEREFEFNVGGEKQKIKLKDINYTITVSNDSRVQSSSLHPFHWRDGDKVDTIAHKYYDSVNKYWVVMYSNGYSDMIYDFPLSNRTFLRYLERKYESDYQTYLDTTPANPYDLLSWLAARHYEYRDENGKVVSTENSASVIEYHVSGTITDGVGDPLVRTIRIFKESDGTLVSESTTDVNGDYDVTLDGDYLIYIYVVPEGAEQPQIIGPVDPEDRVISVPPPSISYLDFEIEQNEAKRETYLIDNTYASTVDTLFRKKLYDIKKG